MFTVLFTFPSRYWSTIGHERVFSLTRWCWQVLTGFLRSRDTQDACGGQLRYVYRAITFFGAAFQSASSSARNRALQVLQPWRSRNHTSLDYSPFARRYSENHNCSLLLQLLRYFSWLGLLLTPMYSMPSDRCYLPGFPIRTSTDQRLFAAPRSLSQLITSFVACSCQGIHHKPYLCLTPTILHMPLGHCAQSRCLFCRLMRSHIARCAS